MSDGETKQNSGPWNVFAMRLLRSLALIVLLADTAAQAQPVEDFYRGSTVNLVIGYSVGGGYDLYGRLLARHLGKYIPGQPNILPQNREGA